MDRKLQPSSRLPISWYDGGKVPKRQLEEMTVAAAQDFEAFYSGGQTDEPLQAISDILVMSVTQKGMIMCKCRLDRTQRVVPRNAFLGLDVEEHILLLMTVDPHPHLLNCHQ